MRCGILQKLSIIFIILLIFTQKLFCQLSYTIWPSQDTTIEITGIGKLNTIIVDNTKNDKDVNLIIETTPSCPYMLDGAFFGVVNMSTYGHANASYAITIAAHTTSQNTNLYTQQPDLNFIREYGSFAVGEFDAVVLVKDSEKIVLREHLHAKLPIDLSDGGNYLISQVPLGTTECVPAFLTNYTQNNLTIASLDDIVSDSMYSFSNFAAFPQTLQPGDQIKLFDACYSPQPGTNYYSRRVFINTDQAKYTALIAGSPCGRSVGQSIWQQQSNVLDQTLANSIAVFPNPATDKLHILLNGNISLQSAELISQTGTIISEFSFKGNLSQVDLDFSRFNLSSSNYFLRLNTLKEQYTKPILLYRR